MASIEQENKDEFRSSQGGFSFENCKRNLFLHNEAGMGAMKTIKTGTTICGVVFEDGVVLGADTRSTGGDIVANKNCEKLHALAPNMVCGGAGTAADCNKVTRMIQSQLELLRLNTGRQVRVSAALRSLKQHLFRYQGYVGTYLIVGGVDVLGPHLLGIHAHGSSDSVPFTALGSGMLAAMAVLETRWQPNMKEKEAKNLVHDAIMAGIFNDMGSGSNVDLAVIKANDQCEVLRGYNIANKKGERKKIYEYKTGTTAILSEFKRAVIVEEKVVVPVADEIVSSSSSSFSNEHHFQIMT